MLGIKKLFIGFGLAILLSPNLVMAGEDHNVNEKHSYEFTSEYKQSKNPFTGVIAEYDLQASNDDDLHFQIRFKDNGTDTEWVDIEADIDGDNKSQRVDALINTNETNEYQYRIISNSGADAVKPKISNIKFKFINPKGEEGIIASIRSMASLVSLSSTSTRIISRSEWGAHDEYNYSANNDSNENLGADKSEVKEDDPEIRNVIETENGKTLKWPMQYIKDMRMIVVHHTASTSELNNPKQAIRNIEYYHAISRGWGDIGYNFIVDQQGNVYEGRKGGARVVGGHAVPVNKTSVGISVLGNFDTQKVPQAVVDAIAKLASEQANTYGLDVNSTVTYKGKAYPVLGGHKDNSPTACPGRNLYNVIPLIRSLAASGATLDNQADSLSNKDYAYVDTDPLRDSVDLKINQTEIVEIKLKNVGQKSWSKSSTYLSSLNQSEYGNGLIINGGNKIATLKESSVASGKTGTFQIEVSAGSKSGAYSLMAQGVLNGETRYSTPIFIPFNIAGATTPPPVQVTGYKYEITGDKNIELELDKNESRTINVTFKNTGDQIWNENFKYVKLGVFSPKDGKSKLISGGARIADFGTEEIAKNKTIKITLDIKAPNEDVTITESYAPVIDGLTWFNDGTPLKLTVKVGKGTQVVEPNVDLQTDSSTGELGPKIRINISNFTLDEANVSTSQKSQILVDSKNVASLGTSDEVEIGRSGKTVTATVNGKDYSGDIIRIVPTSDSNINTVNNYDNRPTWDTSLNDNQFRGLLEFAVIDDGLRMINELPLEYYLRGVAEISNNSNSEKIKTIIVAARSYAYYYLTEAKNKKFPGKGYDLDDSPERTQKYLGYGFEKRSPNAVKAIQETAGKVITYNGKIIVIPYFSQSDGRTRSAKEVWGWDNAPYLVSVNDPDCKTPDKLLGHGVGVSGCGASGMADKGKTHEEILKYFLTGIEFWTAYGKGTTTAPVNVAIFSDVLGSTQYAEAIKYMKDNGIVEGYSDGTFKPVAKINRAEFTKIIIEAKYDSIPAATSCFKDIPTGEWFTKYVCLAKKDGIVEGYSDGTFKPAQEINIAEALKIVLETFYDNIPAKSGEWFMKYKSFAEGKNLFFGSSWSNLANRLVRGEMSELIYRIKK